jgi:4-diphosphocytidyl-2-C-methyl-D-erythritol kinase
MSAARVVVKAFAKINLGLRIVGKRPDGYHEIETLFQSIDLFDIVHLEPAEEQKIYLEITSPWALPTGRENLVYRAAELVLARAGARGGVRIHLEKRIPVGAGLGGGSSDAAATLVGLNALLKLRFDDAQLHALARGAGERCPVFSDRWALPRARPRRSAHAARAKAAELSISFGAPRLFTGD